MKSYIEKSFSVNDEDLEKIKKFTIGEIDKKDLFTFTLALCNNDIDRDNEKFSTATLYEMAEAFIGKTGIKDHSMKSSDQKARIFDAWVEKVENKKTSDNEDFYELKAKAYMLKSDENMTLIKEIEAGIKKEISISCAINEKICSICGESYCDHIRGENYNGKVAFTILNGLKDAYEFSFVAVPAQKGAGVTKKYEALNNIDDILKSFSASQEEIVLTISEQRKIAEILKEYESENKIAKQYKKRLIGENIALLVKNYPAIEIEAISSAINLMSVDALEKLSKSLNKNIIEPFVQTRPIKRKTKNNEFKID